MKKMLLLLFVSILFIGCSATSQNKALQTENKENQEAFNFCMKYCDRYNKCDDGSTTCNKYKRCEQDCKDKKEELKNSN